MRYVKVKEENLFEIKPDSKRIRCKDIKNFIYLKLGKYWFLNNILNTTKEIIIIIFENMKKVALYKFH